MVEIQSDDKTMPFTHEAGIGIIEIPQAGGQVKTVMIDDTIQEHVDHLRKHFEDEATVTLTAYHKHSENGFIFDLEVGGKNYRYVFKVTPEMLNVLKDTQSLIIHNSNEKDLLFLAYVGDCKKAFDQLTDFINLTNFEMSKDKT